MCCGGKIALCLLPMFFGGETAPCFLVCVVPARLHRVSCYVFCRLDCIVFPAMCCAGEIVSCFLLCVVTAKFYRVSCYVL
jgi:hypothetical protein